MLRESSLLARECWEKCRLAERHISTGCTDDSRCRILTSITTRQAHIPLEQWDEIPWGEIEAEIRPLVRLLNDQPGVRTLYSCAGHESGPGYVAGAGYVAMHIDTMDNLCALVRKIDIDNALTERRIASFECSELCDDGVVFSLNIVGQPLLKQRARLREVERILSRSSSQASR